LWETCSEGSPASPVFASAEDLAEWCADGATWWADHKFPAKRWLELFLADDVDSGTNVIMTLPEKGN
jgi:hypothetical protein